MQRNLHSRRCTPEVRTVTHVHANWSKRLELIWITSYLLGSQVKEHIASTISCSVWGLRHELWDQDIKAISPRHALCPGTWSTRVQIYTARVQTMSIDPFSSEVKSLAQFAIEWHMRPALTNISAFWYSVQTKIAHNKTIRARWAVLVMLLAFAHISTETWINNLNFNNNQSASLWSPSWSTYSVALKKDIAYNKKISELRRL